MEERRLDGNAVAGMLSRVLAVDATTVMGKCAGCGAPGAVAETLVYADGPGVVLRCPRCEHVVMRFAEIRGRIVADMRGMASMTF
jgi:hypothetical protein